MTAPDLSVVVLSWNSRDKTLACLEKLSNDGSARSREIIVLDNASEDGSAEAIAERFPGVILMRNPDNLGYSSGNNAAVARASGEFLCLLGSDTEVGQGSLDALISFLEGSSEYGAAAPKLLNPDGTVQAGCMRFPGLLTAFFYDTIWSKFWPGSWIERRYFMRDFDHLESVDIPQPPGTCLMMRRQEFLEMGGMDERLWLFFNDVDLCRRLWRRGRKIRYLAEIEVMHHGGVSTGAFDRFVVLWFRNRLTYYRKHYGRWSTPYMRLIVRMRALEEWFRLGRRHRNPAHAKMARADLRAHVEEILAP